MYAPLVRHLRVYGRTSRYLQGEYRRRCMLRSQHSALFPKLESITMFTSDLYHDSDALDWIEILVAPTLTELMIVPIKKQYATAFVSYPATLNIVKNISERCPQIRRIEFHTANIVNRNDEELPSVLWKDPLSQSFGSLVHLREVTSSLVFINEAGLAILGFLPTLQKLSINGYREHLQELELYAPESAFPVLTHLSLIEITQDNIFTLLTVRPLIRRLFSLSVGQCFEGSSEPGVMWRQSHLWLANVLPLVLKCIPTIKRLSYDSCQRHGYAHQDIDNSSLLQVISELGLEYLSISNMSYMSGLLKEIAVTCSSLIELRVPDQEVLLKDLHWFAQMPNLKILAIACPMFLCPPDDSHQSHGLLEILENTSTHVDNTDVTDIWESARYGVHLLHYVRY